MYDIHSNVSIFVSIFALSFPHKKLTDSVICNTTTVSTKMAVCEAIKVYSANCDKYGAHGIMELKQTRPIDGFLNELFDGRLRPLTKEIIQDSCGQPLTVVYSPKNNTLQPCTPCICEMKLYVNEHNMSFATYDLKNTGYFVTCMFKGESFTGHAMLSDQSFVYVFA
jgi:hypothetical protein